MKIYRISCDAYDKAWLVRAQTLGKARKLVKELTEGYGWHLDYPEEPRTFEGRQVLTKENEVVEEGYL